MKNGDPPQGRAAGVRPLPGQTEAADLPEGGLPGVGQALDSLALDKRDDAGMTFIQSAAVQGAAEKRISG